ncbi:peroxide stress protein YaaA [Lactobacillus sp. CBA3605]|uniref:peroxide stress protein YaaA n=1 Tax=Lactobacillus sp. CBA3605 TaxID=2099788 RepID=UPI000CFC13F1|nr:peroxide stress protein YaaA [Lactobacillus sp. CBA3605]AVK61564.1 peroxide stress protein YaaA [Lactobacillus sp. CBA3605]
MKIIIAPAKKMLVDTDTFAVAALPLYLTHTQLILQALRRLSYPAAKTLWHCSDRLAQINYDWLQHLELTQNLTPALFSFSGIQYQYMAPDIFTAPALAYCQENLRLLSGFYGSLRPFDGVVPYRLEFQAKLSVAGTNNLYDFWGDRLYQALQLGPTEPVINLASEEYAKAIYPYMQPQQPFITIVFASLVNGKLKTKATLAKMARGAMVRFLAEHQVTDIATIQQFDHPDYYFDSAHSTATRLVFCYKK